MCPEPVAQGVLGDPERRRDSRVGVAGGHLKIRKFLSSTDDAEIKKRRPSQRTPSLNRGSANARGAPRS
jgi:hypothetical protein